MTASSRGVTQAATSVVRQFMHATAPSVEPGVRRSSRIFRRWWPVVAFIAVAVVAQELFMSARADVGGHAAEHQMSASAPFMAAALVAIIFWATPAARRQGAVVATAALWLGTTVLVMIGNLRVVDDLIATGNSRTPTSAVPDVADHSLANAAPWYAVVAALLFIGAMRLHRHIGNKATIGAVFATLIVPPWFIPGAGIIVVAAVRAARQER